MNRLFARKIAGITFIVGAVGIFLYLGWFYFIMPRLVVDNKDSLESAFLNHSFDQLYNQSHLATSNSEDTYNGVIRGGVLYEEVLDDGESANGVEKIQLPSHADRAAAQTHLTVPELEIYDAVIQYDVDGTDENIYHTILTRAIAHFGGTAYPGEKGNMFLFGHSKIPILAGTDYESIFTNLPRLSNGALLHVSEGGIQYTYRVNNTAVLSPQDVFILNQPKEERLLTLMTCIPPGFGQNRYVAVASLIGVENV